MLTFGQHASPSTVFCVAVEVTYTQVPNPVSFGGNVTVTSTVADSKFKTMECWLPNGTDVRKLTHGHGVKSANSGNNETTTSAIISLDLAKFPSERTFSCGLDKNASQSYTICGKLHVHASCGTYSTLYLLSCTRSISMRYKVNMFSFTL